MFLFRRSNEPAGAGAPSAPATIARWSMGMGLVTWRYLWSIIPLHRSETDGDESDRPPPIPRRMHDDELQPAAEGCGPLFHRTFRVDISDTDLTPTELITELTGDLNKAVPGEVTSVERLKGDPGDLRLEDELVVHIPGPWDGPVRVIAREPTRFRFATLHGHLEAGQIEFRAEPGPHGLRFEIEMWARPSRRLIHLLYTHLRLAKEIQLNMWVRFCLNAAEASGGKVRHGVHIETRRLAM